MTTSHQQAHKLIEELSSSHCEELFKLYGLELVQTKQAPQTGGALLYCGVIGFSGDHIRGSLAVAGSGGILIASNPTPGGAARDWVAEIANQLMGHVKSRLLGFSVEVYMSTPIVLRGERLALETRDSTHPVVFTNPQGKGEMVLWVDVETTPEFTMSESENTALSGLDGGETLMF